MPPGSPAIVPPTITPAGVTPYALPPGFAELPADEQRAAFNAMLFPPPSEEAVRRVVYASGWSARLGAETSLAAPRDVAAAVFRSISAGQSIRDLAKELLPIVDGVRATARRVARDESMRVAHTMQQEAWNQIDDLIVGYQINAVLDTRTRPEHRARNGTIYYKQPKNGQKGFDEMPDPPRESPKDGSVWAYNCRCWRSPVLVSPDSIAAEPVAAGTVDPDATAAWFDVAPESTRRVAVGSERYGAVKRMLGRKPGWRDFVGPAGELLDVETLVGAG